MGDKYVKSSDTKNVLYVDGHSMSQPLPFDENEFDQIIKLEDVSNAPDDSDIRYFIEINLKYPDDIKKKTKNFPFAPVNKKINPNDFSDYMKTIKPDTYIQTKKLICDWSDKKNYLLQYSMLNFYIRHGMIDDKVHNVLSFKQSKWLEKYMKFYYSEKESSSK